jgi:hypothetical protein
MRKVHARSLRGSFHEFGVVALGHLSGVVLLLALGRCASCLYQLLHCLRLCSLDNRGGQLMGTL